MNPEKIKSYIKKLSLKPGDCIVVDPACVEMEDLFRLHIPELNFSVPVIAAHECRIETMTRELAIETLRNVIVQSHQEELIIEANQV